VGTVVTVMNMKGGVGKTTVAMHLGGMAAQYKFSAAKWERKVLLIDYDPQFNLSQAFLPAKTYFALEGDRKTIMAVLQDDDSQLNPYHLQVPGNATPPKVADVSTRIVAYKDGGVLDIVPSTLDLMYVALGQADVQIKPIEERFEKFIGECRSLYDLIIIDCHPAGSLFTKTSLRNSDHVIIPVMPQRYAVRGIGLMMNFIASKKQGTKSPDAHILFNAVSRTGTHQEEIDIRANPAYAAHCLVHTLKSYRAFSEPEGGHNFVWDSRKPWSTSAWQNLFSVSQEILAKIGVK
jgi:cellulose biosynthesis protein BcsQ